MGTKSVNFNIDELSIAFLCIFYSLLALIYGKDLNREFSLIEIVVVVVTVNQI